MTFDHLVVPPVLRCHFSAEDADTFIDGHLGHLVVLAVLVHVLSWTIDGHIVMVEEISKELLY